MKKIASVLAALLLLAIGITLAALSFSPDLNMDDVSNAFLQEHSGVKLVSNGRCYDTAPELTAQQFVTALNRVADRTQL